MSGPSGAVVTPSGVWRRTLQPQPVSSHCQRASRVQSGANSSTSAAVAASSRQGVPSASSGGRSAGGMNSGYSVP